MPVGCYPCPRTPVTHVSRTNTLPQDTGEGVQKRDSRARVRIASPSNSTSSSVVQGENVTRKPLGSCGGEESAPPRGAEAEDTATLSDDAQSASSDSAPATERRGEAESQRDSASPHRGRNDEPQ